MKKDFTVILYFHPGNGYEIRVRVEGFGSRRAATLFSQKPWDLARSGRSFQLRDDVCLPVLKRDVNLFRLSETTRHVPKRGEKLITGDRDYERVDLPLRSWDSRPALRFGIWGVVFCRVIDPTDRGWRALRKHELRELASARAQSTSIGVTS